MKREFGRYDPSRIGRGVNPTWLQPVSGGLVVERNWRLGDVVMLAPSLLALHVEGRLRLFKTDRIYVDLFRFGPLEGKVVADLPISPDVQLDHYVEQHPEWKRVPRMDLFADRLNITLPAFPAFPFVVSSDEVNQWWARFERPIIVVAWEAEDARRTVDMRPIIPELSKLGYPVVVVGRMRRGEIPKECIDLRGSTSLRDLMAILTLAKVVITPDTGILHLAGALDRPTVAIFRTNLPQLFTRGYRRVLPICPDIECFPCFGECECPGHDVCNRAIPKEAIVEGVVDMMEKKSKGVVIRYVGSSPREKHVVIGSWRGRFISGEAMCVPQHVASVLLQNPLFEEVTEEILPPPAPGRLRILWMMPWLTIGGAEVQTAELIRALRAYDIESVVWTCTNVKEGQDFVWKSIEVRHGSTSYLGFLLREWKPDIVVWVMHNFSESWLDLVQQHVPLEHHVMVLHSSFDWGNTDFIQHAANFGLVVAVSEGAARFAEKHASRFGNRLLNLEIIHNGVDRFRFVPMDKAECRRRLGLPEDGKFGLFLGRIDENKGVHILIEAFPMSGLDWLYIVGPMRSTGQLQIGKTMSRIPSEYRDRIVFVGPTDQPELWYNAVDVTVLPSKYEACPMVAMEALSCGCPLVYTFGEWDLADRVESGAIVAHRTPHDIAAAIRYVLESNIEVIEQLPSKQEMVEAYNHKFRQVCGRFEIVDAFSSEQGDFVVAAEVDEDFADYVARNGDPSRVYVGVPEGKHDILSIGGMGLESSIIFPWSLRNRVLECSDRGPYWAWLLLADIWSRDGAVELVPGVGTLGAGDERLPIIASFVSYRCCKPKTILFAVEDANVLGEYEPIFRIWKRRGWRVVVAAFEGMIREAKFIRLTNWSGRLFEEISSLNPVVVGGTFPIETMLKIPVMDFRELLTIKDPPVELDDVLMELFKEEEELKPWLLE